MQGQAAAFQIIVDGRELQAVLRAELPAPVAEGLPNCPEGGGAPVDARDVPGAPLDPTELVFGAPWGLLSPDTPQRRGVDEALRTSVRDVLDTPGAVTGRSPGSD